MPTHRLRLIAIAGGALGALLIAFTGSAVAKDRNNDRIPDRWENQNRLSLNVKQTHRDQDRDGLDNRHEFRAGTNPRDRDSDNDGVMDNDENAGTIASFDPATGRLTINVFQGDAVTGIVNSQTEISCENENEAGDDQGDDKRSHDGDGGNSGPGSENEGPGNAGDDDNNDNEDEVPCTTADLVPGAVVHEADLELENGQAVFEEVELA